MAKFSVMGNDKFLRMMGLALMFLLASALSVAARQADAGRLRLLGLKFADIDGGTRLVATFDARPDYQLILLDNPVRLVIALPPTDFIAPAESERKSQNKKKTAGITGLVRQTSHDFDGVGGARLIIEGNAHFTISRQKTELLYNPIWQLIIDLKLSSQQDFAEQSALLQKNFIPRSAAHPAQSGLPQEPGQHPSSLPSNLTDPLPLIAPHRPFKVVLDPGHGDFDTGAEGVSGILEKDVTLAFAQSLRDAILRIGPDFVVHLTREKDIFLRLSKRVAIAHSLGADLFVSIHADSIHLPNIRGATVYTISDTASDALAKAIAENENRADLLDGLSPVEPLEVTDILLDLTRRETNALSTRFADLLIEALTRSGVRLIRPAHRHAGFMVLRAPEVPSVLVELGYLSNHHDEKLIADPEWRKSVAATIAQAIKDYSINRGSMQQ